MAETLFGIPLPSRRTFSAPIQIVRRPGAVAWLLEDHSVPVVSLAWSWSGGPARPA
jgi:zinc protease